MYLRLHRVGDADSLQQAHDFVVEVNCAWQIVNVRLAIEYRRRDALQAEKATQHGPDRAAADDDDIGLRCCRL